MSVIDERIVQMVFNNKQFEEGISQSSQSLDNFAEKLNLQGAVDGITQLADHFSAFGVIGDQVLRRIGDKVAQLTFQVTGMAKSLTLDQVGAGFNKFEELTKNTATLVGQGYALEDVNEQLERLNWFTDETSYNFTDMVANIAKFTASGKELPESVTAMQGIATWAALSGQNAATASRAMYQLSQAMSSGNMRKEDYKSIQNASMDTKEFRQTALDAAVALGTLRKNADGTYTSIAKGGKSSTFTIEQFADHLTQELWFTDKVMMDVFQHYGNASDKIQEFQEQFKETHGYSITAARAIEMMGDTLDPLALKAFKAAQEARSFNDVIDATKDAVSTGWMNTFKYVIGDYEEAVELYSGLAEVFYDVFAAGAERRNAILEMWHEKGGYQDALEGFKNIWTTITGVLEPASEAFKELVPWFDDTEDGIKRSTEWLLNLTKGFKEVTNSIRLFFVPAFKDYKSLSEDQANGGRAITADELHAVETAWERMEKMTNIANGIGSIFGIIKEAVSQIMHALSPLIELLGGKLVVAFDFLLTVLSTVGTKITEFKDKLTENQTIFNFVSHFTDAVKELIESFNSFGDATETKFRPVATIVDIVRGAFERLKEIFDASLPVLKKVGTVAKEAFDAIHKGIIDSLNNVDYDKIKDLFGAGLLGGLVLGFKKIADSLSGLASGKNGLLNMLLGESGIEFLDTITEKLKAFHKGINADDLMTLAKAMIVFVGALFLLSIIDSNKLVAATTAMGALMVEIYMFIEDLKEASKGVKFGEAAKMIGLVVGLGAGLLIMSAAVAAMGSMDFEKMTQGLIGVFGMMFTISTFTKMSSGKDTTKIGGLVAFAASLYVLALAVEKFGEIPIANLFQGAAAVSVLGLVMSGLSAIMGQYGGMKLTNGLGMLAMAASLTIIADVVKKLGELDPTALKNGIGTVGLLMAFMAAYSMLTSSTGGMLGAKNLSSAASLLIMAAAISVLSKAMANLAKLNMDQMTTALQGLAVALGAISVAALLMKGTMSSGVSMLLFSTALVVLATALKSLSEMSMEDIGKGMFALCTSMAAFLAVGLLLAPVAGTLILVAGAMALFSVSVIALAAGLTALSGAFAAMGQGLEMGISGIMGALEALIVGIITVIGNSASKFVEMGFKLLMALLQGFVENIDEIISSVAMIIIEILKALTVHIPEIVQAGIEFAVGLLNGFANGIRDNMEVVMSAIGNLLEAILELVLSGLQALLGGIPFVGEEIVQALEDAKGDLRTTFGITGEESGQAMVDGYVAAVDANGDYIYEAGAHVSQTAADGAHGGGGGSWGEAADANIDEYSSGLESEGSKAKVNTASTNVVDSGIEAGKTAASASSEIGTSLANGITSGIQAKIAEVAESARGLVRAAMNAARDEGQIHSPSKVTTQFGIYIAEGLMVGMQSMTSKVAEAAEDMTSSSLDGMQNAISQAMDMVSEESDMNPVITPVLDLSQIQNGVDSLNGMLPGGARLAFGYSGAAGALGYVSPFTASASQNPVVINTNVDFAVTTPTELDERFIDKFGKELADKVNVELGKRVW